MTNTPRDAAPADDAPLDPAAMLAIAGQQTHRMRTLDLRNVVGMLFGWAVAWGVGFIVLWSGLDAGAPFALPSAVASTIFGILVLAAIGLSVALGVRMSRGLRGSSQFAGVVYGWSWSLGSIAAFLIGFGLQRAGMSGELAMLYFPAAYSLVVGLLYLAGAAIWQSKEQLALGVWMILVGSLAPLAGFPWNLPIMAALGGGGFLVGGIVMLVALNRGDRRA